MPGKGHAVFAHELRAVDERVHQKHLPKAQRPRFLPGKEPALRELFAEAAYIARLVLHMFVDKIGDVQIGQCSRAEMRADTGKQLLQARFVQPVVRIDHLIVQPLRTGEPRIHPRPVAAVWLMDGAHDGGIAGGVLVGDRACRIRRAVVYYDDLHLLSALQKAFEARRQISFRVICGDRERDKFLHLYRLLLPARMAYPSDKRTGTHDRGVEVNFPALFQT